MRLFFAWCAAACACVCPSALQAQSVVNTGFEGGSFASSGLNDYSNLTTPTLTAGAGRTGSTGLDFGSDGAAAGATRTIDASASFSMFGRYNGSAGTSNGTLSFGWTKAAADFNPFNGSGTGVASTDHVIVGVARSANNAFRLSAVNGAHGAMNSTNLFGTTAVALTSGNWYRLEGTIGFDSVTKVFTFTNVSLDDFGTAGTDQVTADVLSGTGFSLTAGTFGTDARPLYMTNRDRGFQITDDYFMTPVPEPATVGILSAAGLAFAGMLRRRGLSLRDEKTTNVAR